MKPVSYTHLDVYKRQELTMAAGYYDAGKAHQKATFELTIRRLPAHRNFVIAAGLTQAVDYLLNLSFSAEEIDYLRSLPAFARACLLYTSPSAPSSPLPPRTRSSRAARPSLRACCFGF